jgi:hypothetical protein
MTRLPTALAAAFALAMLWGCARQAPIPDVFPETLGGWHRVEQHEIPAGQPPDAVRGKIERILAATYDGPGKLEARVYVLPTQTEALDAAQNWPAHADTVYFYRDRFFVVVGWQTAERKALQAFVSALQGRFQRK